MGEWMEQIPVKLPKETVARLDLLRGSYPFKPGRSTVIRELVEEGLRLISEGIMQFRATAVNRVPSVQSIPGIPQASTFPIAVEESACTGPKPLSRQPRSPRAVRVNRRSHLAVVWEEKGEYKSPSFPAKVRLYVFNSTRFHGRAA